MIAQRFYRSVATSVLVIAGLSAWSAPSLAQTSGATDLDPLHAFCWGTSACADNGSNTPVSSATPDFGFSISPGPNSGDYVLDILVPDNDPHPASGPTIIEDPNSATPTDFATSLFSTTPWTKKQLDAYLGISASPSNPIGAYVPNPDDASATGYYVYQADIGQSTLCSPSDANNNIFSCAGGQQTPLFTIKDPGLAVGSYVVGFLNTGTPASPNWVATANSGALLSSVPEPATLLLFLAGVMGLFVLRRPETATARQVATRLS